jgi:hypothetical protein
MINKLLDRFFTKRAANFQSANRDFELSFPPSWLQSRIHKKKEYIFFEESTNHGLVIKVHKNHDGLMEKKILSDHEEECLELEFSPEKVNINNGYYYKWMYLFEEHKTLECIKLFAVQNILIEWSYCINSNLDEMAYSKAINIERDLIRSMKIKGIEII